MNDSTKEIAMKTTLNELCDAAYRVLGDTCHVGMLPVGSGIAPSIGIIKPDVCDWVMGFANGDHSSVWVHRYDHEGGAHRCEPFTLDDWDTLDEAFEEFARREHVL